MQDSWVPEVLEECNGRHWKGKAGSVRDMRDSDGPHQPLCHQSREQDSDRFCWTKVITWTGSRWKDAAIGGTHPLIDCLVFLSILGHRACVKVLQVFRAQLDQLNTLCSRFPSFAVFFNIVFGRKKTYQRLEKDFKTLKKKLLLCCKWRSVGSKHCNSTKSFRQSVQRLHRRVWKCHGRANQLDTGRLVGLVGRHKQIVESEV